MRSFCVPIIAATFAAAFVFASGCASNPSAAHNEADCQDVKPGTVTTANAVCVIENEDPVNPAIEPAAWKGQKVGFCCKGCKPQWEKKTDAEKDASLAQAVAKSKH